MRVGQVDVRAVDEGWAALPLAGECPGSGVDWGVQRRRHPWAYAAPMPDGPDPSSWPWQVRLFVLRTPAATVLVDTGIGGYPPPTGWVVKRQPDQVLAEAGVDPRAVSVVVHTHLHSDHAGGAVAADGEPRFPNARHVVHPLDWSHFEGELGDGGPSAEADNVRRMRRLAELGMLDLDPQDRAVTEGVRVVHTPGHTPGHRSVVVADALLLTGDLLHLPVQAEHPGWPSSHDLDQGLGCASRTSLLAEAAARQWVVGVPHFARPFGRVGDAGWDEV